MIDFRKDAKWTVYIHIVSKELSGYEHDKYYVGITSLSTKVRWRSNGSGYSKQIFYYAIQKYGWDNIEHFVIAENLTKDEAILFEKKLIYILDSNNNKYGYNLTDGGEGSCGHSHSKETREKNKQ